MRIRSGKAHWLLCLAGIFFLAGGGVAYWWHHRSAESPSEKVFPLPAYSTSPYLNTGADARYIGSARCAECHPKKHQSYLLTPHSGALSDLNPAIEPPDGSFFHQASGRHFRVYRKDGQLRHEEVVRAEDGREIARVDVPIRYLIGSGHFCRTYLVEIDGFLHESPITWYTAKRKWDVSPGYDFPLHHGFERTVTVGCLVCHAGRVESAPDTVHYHMNFHEKAIGCENCHGPGGKHEALHRGEKYVRGMDDYTIVNPAKLSRERLESICAFCHLNGPASSYPRGRGVADFRPGMPLTDYRIDYRYDEGSEQMTVVGHIEQLRQSACYRGSDKMTCLTCHDPHAREKPADPIAYYRQKCIDCHGEQGCKLDRAVRLKKEPRDNCTACHMPRGDTDIPHVAFTHHRIGLHKKQQFSESTRVPELVPTDDVSHLSPLDQKRGLGLAYLEAFRNPVNSRYAPVFADRVRALLEAVRAEGLRDPETAEALAHVCYEKKDFDSAREYAQEALGSRDLSPDGRAIALIVLALCEIQDHNPRAAIGHLEELGRMRRYADDWRLLGKCYLDEGQPIKALSALEHALAIRPYRHAIHLDLAEVYRLLGSTERAADHLGKARWLFDHKQD